LKGDWRLKSDSVNSSITLARLPAGGALAGLRVPALTLEADPAELDFDFASEAAPSVVSPGTMILAPHLGHLPALPAS
jgi:hypothetical protein